MTAKTNANISNLTAEQLAAIVSAAVVTAMQAMNDAPPAGEVKPAAKAPKAPAKAKAPKPKAEAKAPKPKHDPALDTKRVERMTATATAKLAKAGFVCKTRKQGAWMWVYPTDGQGRTDAFKSVKLAKGWKHSMRRGAFYRDFSQA